MTTRKTSPCVNGAGRVRGDNGGKCVDRGPQDTNACSKEDDGDGGNRVISRGDHNRDQQHIESERFFGHSIGGAAEGKQRHQERDHPLFPSLELGHSALDSGIYRACRGDDPDEPANHQDEKSDIDGVCGAGCGVVEPADWRHDDVDYPCGAGSATA